MKSLKILLFICLLLIPISAFAFGTAMMGSGSQFSSKVHTPGGNCLVDPHGNFDGSTLWLPVNSDSAVPDYTNHLWTFDALIEIWTDQGALTVMGSKRARICDIDGDYLYVFHAGNPGAVAKYDKTPTYVSTTDLAVNMSIGVRSCIANGYIWYTRKTLDNMVVWYKISDGTTGNTTFVEMDYPGQLAFDGTRLYLTSSTEVANNYLAYFNPDPANYDKQYINMTTTFPNIDSGNPICYYNGFIYAHYGTNTTYPLIVKINVSTKGIVGSVSDIGRPNANAATTLTIIGDYLYAVYEGLSGSAKQISIFKLSDLSYVTTITTPAACGKPINLKAYQSQLFRLYFDGTATYPFTVQRVPYPGMGN